jgi:hypothetical protein
VKMMMKAVVEYDYSSNEESNSHVLVMNMKMRKQRNQQITMISHLL